MSGREAVSLCAAAGKTSRSLRKDAVPWPTRVPNRTESQVVFPRWQVTLVTVRTRISKHICDITVGSQPLHQGQKCVRKMLTSEYRAERALSKHLALDFRTLSPLNQSATSGLISRVPLPLGNFVLKDRPLSPCWEGGASPAVVGRTWLRSSLGTRVP